MSVMDPAHRQSSLNQPQAHSEEWEPKARTVWRTPELMGTVRSVVTRHFGEIETLILIWQMKKQYREDKWLALGHTAIQ